jgi:hypothetical protein
MPRSNQTLTTLLRPLSLVGLLLAALILAFAMTWPGPVVADASDTEREPLLSSLRNGGLILYFRHTSTDFGQNDDQMTGYEDCARQRNLTEQGRQEARELGEAMRRLQLPIGDVLASPFCRTLETAQLIFGRATRDPAVRGGPGTTSDPERYRELRTLLSTAPRPGTDLAIVSHGNPYNAVVGPPYLAEGEAAIIQPLGAEGFKVIARLRKNEWKELSVHAPPRATQS